MHKRTRHTTTRRHVCTRLYTYKHVGESSASFPGSGGGVSSIRPNFSQGGAKRSLDDRDFESALGRLLGTEPVLWKNPLSLSLFRPTEPQSRPASE